MCIYRFLLAQLIVNYVLDRPNGQLVGDFVAWCRTKTNFVVFGAPWQADAQLIFLYEKYKWIQGVISEDSDIWTMGKNVKEWHAGYSTCSTAKYRHCMTNCKSVFLRQMSAKQRFLVLFCLLFLSALIFAYVFLHVAGSNLQCGPVTIFFRD